MIRIQIEREKLGLATRVHEETTGNTQERKDAFHGIVHDLRNAIAAKRNKGKPPTDGAA